MLASRKKRFPILPFLAAAAAFAVVRLRSGEGRDQLERGAIWLSQTLDRTIGWPNLPTLVGALVLVGNRMLLRRKNLYDTAAAPSIQDPSVPPPVAGDTRYLTVRTADGSYNDLGHPDMGRAGTRFGRNVPIE